MGKIRRIFGKLRFRNLSLRQALVLLTILALILAIVVLGIEMRLLDEAYDYLIGPYLSTYEIAPGYYTNAILVEVPAFTGTVVDLLPNIRMVVFFLTVALLIVGEAILFYRLKLKRPLVLLSEASQKIAAGDLNFSIAYPQSDEMGRLCTSFETMRAALEENNRTMWRTMQERRRLNAAFAHDLRTPLTVLRGYTELLCRYLPEDRIPRDKLIETASTMHSHVGRLEHYVSSMNQLQKLEDITLDLTPIRSDELVQTLHGACEILCSAAGRRLHFSSGLCTSPLVLDTSLVQQVLENLVSNAARYARSLVEVLCCDDGEILSLTVEDDGPGFSPEALTRATQPFYRAEGQSDETHFGLGLNICQTLCAVHGGTLTLGNSGHGARLTATFTLKNWNSR